MNPEEARRKGFKMKLVKAAPQPEPVVVPPAPVPVHVAVTVENTGLTEVLAKIQAPAPAESGNGLTAAFMQALQRNTDTVVAAAAKIPARSIVTSCDLTHEYDVQSRMPVITSIRFNYDN